MIPDENDDLDALCAWWAREGEALSSAVYRVRRRVEGYVRDNTVVVTGHGTLEAQAAGWEWDPDAVSAVAPECISGASVTFAGSLGDVERTLSLILEEIPQMEFSVGKTIDKRRANKLANAGGLIGQALQGCRVAKAARVVVKR